MPCSYCLNVQQRDNKSLNIEFCAVHIELQLN